MGVPRRRAVGIEHQDLPAPRRREIRTRTLHLDIAAAPGARLVTYTPTDAESRERIGWLLAHPELAAADHRH